MCVETLRTGHIFLRWLIGGVTCLGLFLKLNMFLHLSHWKPHKCVLKPSEQGSCFSKTINLRGHMPRYTLKMNVFPFYLIGNPINVCWNPQKMAQFSKTINLRGYMPRFTLKLNIFFIYLLGNPINVCWNPQNRAHVFPQDHWFEGSHA